MSSVLKTSFAFGVAALNVWGADVWETRGFDAFRRGEFSAGGANLYVSKSGRVQTVNRWDVNNDGHFDLIFNNTHDLMYVVPSEEHRFEKSSRSVGKALSYPGAGAVRVRIVDLNGDGMPELIIARGFDNSTRVQNSAVYWGAPQGWTDKFRVDLPTPYVSDACVGDVNGDGRLDLVFASGRETNIYWGRSDGYFLLDRTELGTAQVNGCLVGDFDQDRHDDLVLTAEKESRIYWGPGKPKDFSALTLPGEQGAIGGGALIGRRVVIATRKGPLIGLFQNRRFMVHQHLDLPGAGRLTVGDVNGDGLADMVVARPGIGRQWSTTSRIYLASGSRGAEKFSNSSAQDLPTLGAVESAIGDLDADGHADVIFANNRDALTYDVESSVFWGAAAGFTPDRQTRIPTHGAEGVAVHGSHVVFANSTRGRITGDIDTYIYLGDAQGRYSTARMLRLPTIGGYESCAADFNNDGFNDVLLVGSHEGDMGSNVGSWIYWGDSKGLSPQRRSDIPTRGAIGCAVGDLNRDGFLDLLFSNLEDHTAQILWGGVDGYAAHREQNLPAKEPRFPSVADLNKDGYLDLLIPSLDDGLLIYWGAAQGFQSSNKTAIPSVGIVSQQVADLDRDGYLDIIMCNLMDVARSVYHGVYSQILWGSAGGYNPQRRAELPSSGAHHAVVADFNRDGFLDIFVSNYQSDFTRSIDSHIYWGDASGTYSPERRLPLHNESAAGVVAGDLNNDGWVDLAVSNHVLNGDHHGLSLIFWNRKGTFSVADTTKLPTIGPHMMTGVEPGNHYSRRLEEAYFSDVYDAGGIRKPVQAAWEGHTPFESQIAIELRGAELETVWQQRVGTPQICLFRIVGGNIESRSSRDALPGLRWTQSGFVSQLRIDGFRRGDCPSS